MLPQRAHLFLAAASVWLMTTAAASFAVPINYGNFMGTGVTYIDVTEDSLSDPTPLFGGPTVMDDALDFNPVPGGFAASESAGEVDVTDGRLTFMVQANPQHAIADISFGEAGDTTLAGFGTDATSSVVAGTVSIDILEVDGVGIVPLHADGPVNFVPSGGTYGLLSDGGGGPLFSVLWTGSLMVDIEQVLTIGGIPFTQGATRIAVDVDNSLMITSEPTTSAQIQKTDFGVMVTAVDFSSQTSILLTTGTWTDNAIWSTPLFPNNGNGGFNYNVVINNGSTATIPAVVNIEINDLTLGGGAIESHGSLTVHDTANWTEGALLGTGTIELAGTTNISGTAPKALSGSVTNSGTLNWQEGLISFFQAGVVEAELHNTGTINVIGFDTSFSFGSGSPLLVNEATGTLSRAPSPATATIDVATINHGRVELQGNLAFTRGLTNAPTGVITNDMGTIQGDVTNAGRIAPGSPLGILTIDGNFTQVNTGVLEIEVGGTTTAGTDYDQLAVTGLAILGGRLDLPIVNSFVPVAGTEVTVLTGNPVLGSSFNALFSPNLASVSPGVAIDVVYSPNNVRVIFATPEPGGPTVTVAPSANWATPTTWFNNDVPRSIDVVAVQNVVAGPQELDVVTADAFTHQLSVTGTSAVNTMTVDIQNGKNLSATAGVTVGDNAIIKLNNGNLVSSTVDVQGGGRLSGNGTVVGKLLVGTTAGPQPATLSPGLSVGHLEVVGDYQQGQSGRLEVDIEAPSEFDTINVSGAVKPGGTLRIDATNLAMPTPGTVFPLITAGSLVEDAVFATVETIGSVEFVFVPIYTPAPGPGGGALGGSGSSAGGASVSAVTDYRGNMDRDANPPWLDQADDTAAFALALKDPFTYFSNFGTFGQAIGDLDGYGTDNFHPNGRLDFDDIMPFAILAAGSGTGATTASILARIEALLQPVPEPNSALLLFCGSGLLLIVRGGRRGESRHGRRHSHASLPPTRR